MLLAVVLLPYLAFAQATGNCTAPHNQHCCAECWEGGIHYLVCVGYPCASGYYCYVNTLTCSAPMAGCLRSGT